MAHPQEIAQEQKKIEAFNAGLKAAEVPVLKEAESFYTAAKHTRAESSTHRQLIDRGKELDRLVIEIRRLRK